MERGDAAGNTLLRRAQFMAAVVDKNPTMLIWLGKQWLGQTDRPRHDVENASGTPIRNQVEPEISRTELITRKRVTGGSSCSASSSKAGPNLVPPPPL